MKLLEALYVVEFGDIAGLGYRNGGVAVLETGKIFGGDSGYYYIGDYSSFGDLFEASVRITKHNPQWVNAFGDDALQFDIRVLGTIQQDMILGAMERVDRPGLHLQLRLIRRATLP